jgi:MATE family multidrug resistance protein
MLSEIVDASFNFTATLFSAHLGVQELAAGGLVTTLFITIMIFMWGILVAISTLISQRHGAKDDAGIARVLHDGLILASLFSIPGMLLVWNMAPILLFFGQNQVTIHIAEHYLHALTWAVLPDFWAVVLLQFVIGLGKTRLALLFNAVKVPVTLIVSYLFMFGKFNLPKLGIAGLGWGITSGMWFASLLLLSYTLVNKQLRHYLLMRSTATRHYFGEILRTGLPIAGMFCIEIGFFTVSALIMGRISSLVLAANQIVTQFTGFFTVVISFCYSQAVGIRIGHSLGEKDLTNGKTIAKAGILVALSLMLIVALCYWIIPERLIAIDLDPRNASNRIIIDYAVQFMLVAGFVQLFEAARLVLFGALRGLGETHYSMMTSLIIFWLIAFPLGYFLTFVVKLGGVGMWLGMAVGTFVGAILLARRLNKTLSRHQ